MKSLLSKVIPLTKKDITLLKRTVAYVNPYKVKFILAFLFTASEILFSLIPPYCFGKIIQSVMIKDSTLFTQMLLIMGGAFLLQQGISILQTYLFTSLNENMVYDVKRDMYKKILHLPVRLFDQMRVGEFLSRLNGDAGTISNIITNQFLNTVISILRVLIIGFTAFSISKKLLLIVLLSFPVSMVMYIMFGKLLRKRNIELAQIRDNLYSNSQETLVGIREVRSMGINDVKNEEFLKHQGLFRDKSIKLGLLSSVMQTSTGFIKFISEITVLFLGFYMVTSGELKIELFIAFTSYAGQFTEAFMSVTGLNASLQQSLVAIGRIFDVIDSFSHSDNEYGNKKVERFNGDIQFENVRFAYSDDRYVFEDLTMDIPAGKKVAIVGNSGVGKTTLYNLLLRFYKPSSGVIRIDGEDIKDLTEESLLNNIAVVRQDVTLFNISIRDNLRLASPKSQEEDIIEACKSAHIYNDIISLPHGFDSVLGERGVKFSGGQKQRLAIARALLKKSPIILFDEATSALDNESQYKIKKAIEEIGSKYTVIIIAHRLLTIVDADIIYVLSHGKVVGKGKHEDLILNNSVYRDLYKMEVDTLVSKQFNESTQLKSKFA